MHSNHRPQLSRKSSPLYITLSSDQSADENENLTVSSEHKPANKPACITSKKPIEYIPLTIDTQNQTRLSILPMFPTSMNDCAPSRLLLVNVSEERLSFEQLSLRRHYQQTTNQSLPNISNKENRSIPSSLRNYFETNYQLFLDLFHINWRILDYNYTRLDNCLRLFADERTYRLRQTPYDVRLLDEEKSIAMEVFLQLDVDLFYWKTFSNSHRQMNDATANVDTSSQSLFSKFEPRTRFSMNPCGHSNCRICSPTDHITCRPYPSVDFKQSAMYQFLNGYKSILNAPVMCNTNGIIYVLKCPCGQYEYVGESSNNLMYTLDRHRTNGSRIMHYFLIGDPNISDNAHNNISFPLNSSDIMQKNSMRLYQHSSRCTTVMQMFLNCYPHYWIFVPLSISSAQQENVSYIKCEPIFSTSASFRSFTIPRATTEAIRNDHEIQLCLKNIPLPPPNYQFSKRQRDQQIDFFRHKKDQQQLPDLPLHLYDASIIVVLPTKTSPVLRQFLVSLFITHGQANLNAIGNLLSDSNTNLSFPLASVRGNWCHNLTSRRSFMLS